MRSRIVRLIGPEATDATRRLIVAVLDQFIVKPEIPQEAEVEIYFLNDL